MEPEVGRLELQATGVLYYSKGDEEAFFGWLGKIACVDGYRGRGDTLYINIAPGKADETGVRELLALFRRYGVDLGQLVALDRKEFSAWFRDKDAFWHEDVFGDLRPAT